MPITHMHGCRFPLRPTDPLLHYKSASENLGLTQGRTGRGYTSTSSSHSTVTPRIDIVLPSSTFSIGFAWRLHESATTNSARLAIGNASGVADHIYIPLFSALTAPTGTSGTSTWTLRDATPIPAGWHWINITGVLNHATAGHVRIYRNGTLILEKGTDTLPSTAYPLQVGICMGQSSNANIISDIVIRDDNVLIPDSRVDTLVPNGDVDALWTPSTGTTRFPVVADGLTTTWVASSTVDQQQRFTLEDLPHNPASVEAVRLNLASGKDDAGARTMAALVNGVEDAALDSGSLDYRSQIYLTDPADSQPWTTAKVNGMTVGAVVKA